jgi:hypothetical protein
MIGIGTPSPSMISERMQQGSFSMSAFHVAAEPFNAMPALAFP